jgi:hypothetical protein
MISLPQEGETWRHYKKGDLYKIIGIAKQESDNCPVVVYKSTKSEEMFTRPVKEFIEKLETGYRFKKIDKSVCDYH